MASDRHTTEITDAEKSELVAKVYPRLKKRRKLLRLLKIGNAVLALLMFVSCTAVHQPTPKAPAPNLLIKKEMSAGDNPENFAKTMPASDVILSSVIRFAKQPTVKHIADDVIDMDYENGTLVLLKGDRLETNRMNCPSILLPKDRYLSVKLENGLALITGASKAVLADVDSCGTIHQTDSRGKGFSLSDKYLLEFSRNTFSLYNTRWSDKLHGGDFLGSVIAGELSGGNVMFANENGKIALMNGATGKYTAIYPGTVDISQIAFHGDSVYVLDGSHKLIKLKADYADGTLNEDGSAQAKDGCFFLKRSPRLYCDGYIFGLNSAYKLPVKADKGLVRDGLIFLINDGVLYYVDPKLTYKKSVLLAPKGERLCLKDGRAYFTDLDGSAKYVTAAGEEHKAKDVPDSCDYRFGFKQGTMRTPSGKVIYRFANVVNRSDKYLMMKRVLNGDVYYYFEKSAK